jgi:hypothetical protein
VAERTFTEREREDAVRYLKRTGATMHEAELRLRTDGFLDSADMMRQFADGLDRGEVVLDESWADRGRIQHLGPCFGLNHGEVTRKHEERHG